MTAVQRRGPVPTCSAVSRGFMVDTPLEGLEALGRSCWSRDWAQATSPEPLGARQAGPWHPVTFVIGSGKIMMFLERGRRLWAEGWPRGDGGFVFLGLFAFQKPND